MKHERDHHGAVDKSFSEQRICIVDANYILREKNWTRTYSGTGSYGRQAGGRQVADEIQVNLEIFKNHCTSKDSNFASFNQGTASLQQYKCIPGVFQVKSIVKLVF